MKFWWIICGIFLGSRTGLGGFGIWSEDLFWRETKKIRFSSHFGPPETKNQKLMRKIKLVQGWPKNGAQIRKLQNTEDLEKALQSHQISYESWPENQGDLLRSKDHSKIPGFTKFGLLIQLWSFQALFTSKCRQKNSPVPWSGPANKITSKSWGRAKRWLRSWKWVGRRDIIHLWKPNPQKDSQITHLWNSRRPFYSFFSLNHQNESDKGFSWFFEAINLELLLRGFQNIFWWFFDERLGARPGCSLGNRVCAFGWKYLGIGP